jgi:septum formation protein
VKLSEKMERGIFTRLIEIFPPNFSIETAKAAYLLGKKGRVQWFCVAAGAKKGAKARAAARLSGGAPGGIVLGADTTVALNDEILGKPCDASHAREMLAKLSGRTHYVLTGIFLLRLPDFTARAAVETSAVTFAPLSKQEIEDYVATGEPLGKAGAYAIQGLAGRFIPKIEGCYFNVVGLPLAKLYALLCDLDWQNGS